MSPKEKKEMALSAGFSPREIGFKTDRLIELAFAAGGLCMREFIKGCCTAESHDCPFVQEMLDRLHGEVER